MIDFAADLFHLMDPDVFGVQVTLVKTGETFRGLLDLNPVILSTGEANISTNTHLLTVREIDTESINQQDKLIIKEVEYSVSDLRPDGTGAVEITIHKTVKDLLL